MPGPGFCADDLVNNKTIMAATTLNLVVDNVPYIVTAEPFVFNEEERFRVTYNGGPAYIFAWDEELYRFAAIGDEAATFPDNLEQAIARQLKVPEDKRAGEDKR